MARNIKIQSIGFTQKSAKQFFESLRNAGVARVVDVRLNNVSQLAGFSKRADLEYFLKEITGIDYVHLPILAPTQEMLDALKKQRGTWAVYEEQFLSLMAAREIEKRVDPLLMNGACLLCSEDKPHHCHRRLVAGYLKDHWPDVEIQHL